jgi:hypothetical protein
MKDSGYKAATNHFEVDEGDDGNDAAGSPDSLMGRLDDMIAETRGISRNASPNFMAEDPPGEKRSEYGSLEPKPLMTWLPVLPVSEEEVVDDEYMSGALPITNGGIQDDDYIIEIDMEANQRYRELLEQSRQEADVKSTGSTSGASDNGYEIYSESEQLGRRSSKGKQVIRQTRIDNPYYSESPSNSLAVPLNLRKVADTKRQRHPTERLKTTVSSGGTRLASEDIRQYSSISSFEGQSSNQHLGRRQSGWESSSRTLVVNPKSRRRSVGPAISPKSTPMEQQRRRTVHVPVRERPSSSKTVTASNQWRVSSLSGKEESRYSMLSHEWRGQEFHQDEKEQFVELGYHQRSIAPHQGYQTSGQYVTRSTTSSSHSIGRSEEDPLRLSISDHANSDQEIPTRSPPSQPSLHDQIAEIHPLTRAKFWLDAAVLQAHFAYSQIKEIKQRSKELEKDIKSLEREREMFHLMKKGNAFSNRSWSTNSQEQSDTSESTLGWTNLADLVKRPPTQTTGSSTRSSLASENGRKPSKDEILQKSTT